VQGSLWAEKISGIAELTLFNKRTRRHLEMRAFAGGHRVRDRVVTSILRAGTNLIPL
jgi:hypothetical protein